MKVKEQFVKQNEIALALYIDYEEWLKYNNPPLTNKEINHMEITLTK